MKKFLSLLLAIMMIFTLAGCNNAGGNSGNGGGSDEPADLTGKPIRIIQYVVQSIGNLSCEDLVNEGLKDFCSRTGSTLDVFETNGDDKHFAEQINELCSSGKYDVLVTGYWNLPEYIEQAAIDFPNMKFIAFDCEVDFEAHPEIKQNVATYSCRQNSLAFAAGALGALITESGKGLANEDKTIGFVGGGENSAIFDFLLGYIQGAHYVDPEIRVLYSYVGNWSDTARANDLATDQYNSGADVVFAVCAPASFGVCEAAYNAKRYAFGVDTDHSGQLKSSHPEQAEYTISSAVKQFGYAIRDAFDTIYDGTIVWGTNNWFDFDSGYLEMLETDMFNTQIKEGMPEVYEAYQQIVAKLAASQIEVGTAIGADQAYLDAEFKKADPSNN
jgi:basic membrane protein A